MAQVLIKYEDSSWNYARMHPLQYIEGRTVQITIDIGKGQRLVVIFLVLIFKRFQERRDCVLEQTFVPRNLTLNIGDRSSGRVSTGRFVSPCLGYTGESVKACKYMSAGQMC